MLGSASGMAAVRFLRIYSSVESNLISVPSYGSALSQRMVSIPAVFRAVNYRRHYASSTVRAPEAASRGLHYVQIDPFTLIVTSGIEGLGGCLLILSRASLLECSSGLPTSLRRGVDALNRSSGSLQHYLALSRERYIYAWLYLVHQDEGLKPLASRFKASRNGSSSGLVSEIWESIQLRSELSFWNLPFLCIRAEEIVRATSASVARLGVRAKPPEPRNDSSSTKSVLSPAPKHRRRLVWPAAARRVRELFFPLRWLISFPS
ncbi:hypothetical protein FNV43_RR12918 [Rhamnella rubrinervis]|uniref:Uncharacterized protein n=1 Tax=Rhamnella rubrinervis TaxID=2594499 RepID=A0A8K0H028_9ROSA|nr:hypothetical protein FNV43_RR12918 [Rhamnella rubrinervis]